MVKALPLVLGWILSSAVVAQADGPMTTNGNGAQLFQFKFDPNKPLTYQFEVKSGQMNDTTVGQRSTLTRTTVDTRFKVRLTAVGTNADGTISVYYEPYDYEQDSRSSGPSGEIECSTRNLDVVSKQNGIVTVDTQNGVGRSQWLTMKQSVYPHLLSGYMDFDLGGRVEKFEGDLPFIDNWQHFLQYSSNLFYIVFPANGLAITDTWTNYYHYNTAGPVAFDNGGIVQPWSFTRGPDQAGTNGPLATFTLYMSYDDKDLTGYTDQGGQRSAIDIPEQVESMNASFQFDQKRGCLVSMTQSENLHGDMNMVLQGNSATAHDESENNTTITLISP
jgi:hypothetical protein